LRLIDTGYPEFLGHMAALGGGYWGGVSGMIEIIYLRDDLILPHRRAVEAVAVERVYLGMVTLPPFDPERAFARRLIENNWPIYAAMEGANLVGWADIIPIDGPETEHRGILGMGLLAPFRGLGLGARLLDACLKHAPLCGISKIELTVFTTNVAAIALYRKAGFAEVGVIEDYRRRDSVNYDALLMELFVG